MVGFDHILTLVIALIGSAGFWSFISMREKHKRDVDAAYSTTLKAQVDRLAVKLDDKTEQIEELLTEIAELRSELSAAKVTINHLENLLRTR